MRLALAQINPIVGDLAGNRSLILERLEDAKGAGADLVPAPEGAVAHARGGVDEGGVAQRLAGAVRVLVHGAAVPRPPRQADDVGMTVR